MQERNVHFYSYIRAGSVCIDDVIMYYDNGQDCIILFVMFWVYTSVIWKVYWIAIINGRYLCRLLNCYEC